MRPKATRRPRACSTMRRGSFPRIERCSSSCIERVRRVRKYTIGPYGHVTLHQAHVSAQKVFAARLEGCRRPAHRLCHGARQSAPAGCSPRHPARLSASEGSGVSPCLKMIEHGKTEHHQCEQAKQYGSDAQPWPRPWSLSIIPEPMETQSQTLNESWICLTPCHSGLPPTCSSRRRFAPGTLKGRKTDKAKSL
jgi:hypothetical protein